MAVLMFVSTNVLSSAASKTNGPGGVVGIWYSIWTEGNPTLFWTLLLFLERSIENSTVSPSRRGGSPSTSLAWARRILSPAFASALRYGLNWT